MLSSIQSFLKSKRKCIEMVVYPGKKMRPIATMKYLAVTLLLCALVSLSNAECFVKGLKKDATHCQDDVDGTWHAVGSKWRNSRCFDCTCTGCCSAFSTPIQFPDDCVSVFDSEACAYIVHKKDDPSTLCPIYGAVGKWWSGLKVWSIFVCCCCWTGERAVGNGK